MVFEQRRTLIVIHRENRGYVEQDIYESFVETRKGKHATECACQKVYEMSARFRIEREIVFSKDAVYNFRQF